MTADDAFDKLLGKNAINIPVANPSAGTGVRTAATVPAARPDSAEEALRVMSLIGREGDYHPRGYDDDAQSSPTETDLPPVDEEVDAAYLQGARVLGRDVDVGEFDESSRYDDGDDGRELPEATTIMDSFPGTAGLDRARTVRRFSYLPLEGADQFDARSRDIMASLASQDPDRPSLAITSPALGYGQTEIAIRMALAVAKKVDYRVLLVDFDVRKPQVAARLGVSAKYFTVSDVLRGSCPLGEALTYSEEDNLYVLPARASDRDGDEVLDDRQVQHLMTQAHATFDFVIICCGPMDHADATIICRHAGATALAAFCNQSKARALRDAAERLAESGVSVAGLLLTGALQT